MHSTDTVFLLIMWVCLCGVMCIWEQVQVEVEASDPPGDGVSRVCEPPSVVLGIQLRALERSCVLLTPNPLFSLLAFFFYNTHWFTTFLTPHIPELIQSEITLLRSKIYSVVLILLFIYSNINFSKIPFLLFKLLFYYLIVVLNIYFFTLHKFCNYII